MFKFLLKPSSFALLMLFPLLLQSEEDAKNAMQAVISTSIQPANEKPTTEKNPVPEKAPPNEETSQIVGQKTAQLISQAKSNKVPRLRKSKAGKKKATPKVKKSKKPAKAEPILVEDSTTSSRNRSRLKNSPRKSEQKTVSQQRSP